MASWLMHSTPERVVWVQALAGDIVLCSWARHFTLTVPLSTQVYKWVLANLIRFYGTSSKTQLMERDVQTSETVSYCI